MNKTKIIINKEWDEIFNKYAENNFSNHAFPLFLFTERLYNQLAETDCKDVLFMSREGQFLKVLFERYCQIRKELGLEVKDIKTHYFYGSRNSIMTASSKPIEEEDFDLMFRFFKYFIKPKGFLFSIGFSEKQIDEVRKSYGKSLDKVCFNFKTSKALKKLKQNETFKRIYEENRTKQSVAFGEYMKTFNVDYANNGLVFVDIGYHGTMQDLIFKFFNEKVNIKGYFIKNRSKQNPKNLKYGLLGDGLNKHLFGSKINKYDTFNYEQILRADHGRCLGYEFTTSNEVKPIIDTEHHDVEIYEKYIRTLQEQILDKFQLIAHKSLLSSCDIEKICTIYYYYTIKYKTKLDYEWILNMQDCHHDDFGYVGYPGKAFARGLRKFVFKLKDKLFILNKSGYAAKLKKSINNN